jgi:membrane protease subunit (stomatin/prohibitin family)
MAMLEVIDFFDPTNRSLVHRVPNQGTADIKIGAQLIVQQQQEAVFYRDGKAMDVFGPGRFTLTTANIPFITKILTIPWEKSPFQACVYFVGKQDFIDQKWGTRQPITIRDNDFGMVRLRSFGKFSYRVTDSTLLIDRLVGTQGIYTTEQVTSYMKDVIVSRMKDLIATSSLGLLDLQSRYDEIAAGTRAKVSTEFAKYGLELVDFFINSINVPEKVQEAIDARSSMGAIGDLRSFTMYQAAKSMEKMAENSGGEGGAAGGAMQMGMGAGFGMMMPGMIQQAMMQGGGVPAGPGGGATAGSAGTIAAAGVPMNFDSLQRVHVDPQKLVDQVIANSGWTVEKSDNVWEVIVPIGSLRKQKLTVEFGHKDAEGQEMVRYSSVCGPATPENSMQLLQFNAEMVHGAFAVHSTDSGDMVVVQANEIVDTMDLLEVMRVMTAVAWQADKVEEKLTGGDDH